ncbi:MAG: GreA/GreB family elongation factor [Firmicutes bacterium]|uniref:Transcription elongation factor GreA n=1 Tax=Candidatus Scatoplasma merdavium TaxID=2840932 RepID=A0A9D9GR81_9BACL|nr:GreA/GreB family elongation factor [Candidatus Scatoplasma merdavium]
MKLTRESFDKLIKQLNEAMEYNKVLIVEIEEARKQGDLSENADYSAAMDKKRQNDALIDTLRKQVEQAEVAEEPTDYSKVTINCRVELEKVKDKTHKVYIIGDSISANPDEGIISEFSPIGKAIINRKVGETVNVEAKNPYAVTILSITPLNQ